MTFNAIVRNNAYSICLSRFLTYTNSLFALLCVELSELVANYDQVSVKRVVCSGDAKEDPTIYVGSGGVVYALMQVNQFMD